MEGCRNKAAALFSVKYSPDSTMNLIPGIHGSTLKPYKAESCCRKFFQPRIKIDVNYQACYTEKVFNDILGFRALCDSYEPALRRRLEMCYLIAKNKHTHGCYALKTTHGKHLVEMKEKLNTEESVMKGIQLVTISRPTAYGEYAPYHFVEDEQEFEKLVRAM